MSAVRFNILDFAQQKIRMLHISWFAFFLTFMVWFNHAPLMGFLKDAFDLTSQEMKALLILNVALTIPARIIIGILVDKFGPRIVYGSLLILAGILCTAFALSTSYEQLALFRFLMGLVGAGFVIGIRLVSEWFPAREVGIAEGIYGGWGNFGSAASAMLLPTLALIFGGENGWRYALLVTAVIAVIYGLIFLKVAKNTPDGSTYFKPKKTGGLEVTSKFDLLLYLFMNVPMYLALAILVWKLSPANLNLLGSLSANIFYVILIVLFLFQSFHILKVNRRMEERAGAESLLVH